MPEPTEPTAYKYGLCEGCGKIFVRRYETQKYCTMLCNPKKQKKVDRKKEPEISIMEITRRAAAEHLTYGQYCAKPNL